MHNTGLGIFSLEELKELQERAERALQAIQRPVEFLPAGTVPAITLIQMDELLRKINQYADEIRLREAADAARKEAAGLKLFLSYRRKDDLAMGSIGRIRDVLVEHFGELHVFLDHYTILHGEKFAQVIEERVKCADFLLAVMGHQWLEVLHSKRHDDLDHVRFELETAFKHGIPVIPLLLGNAAIPKEHDLPPSLASLPFLNASFVDPGQRFHADMLHLVENLKHRVL